MRIKWLLILVLLGQLYAGAASVMLAWNPSTSQGVAGYNIYYGGASRHYTNMVSVGAVTNASLTNLVAYGTYFFAATARNSTGLESDYSVECVYIVPPDSYHLKVVNISVEGETLPDTWEPLVGWGFSMAAPSAYYRAFYGPFSIQLEVQQWLGAGWMPISPEFPCPHLYASIRLKIEGPPRPPFVPRRVRAPVRLYEKQMAPTPSLPPLPGN